MTPERREEWNKKRRAYNKKYHSEMSDEQLEWHKKKCKEWYYANKRQAYLNRLRNRCEAEGIPFNLTLDDLYFPEICPVLNIPMDYENKRSEGYWSLDKIIPVLGYIRGNVKIISARANRIKNDGTAEEHLQIADYIKRETSSDYVL
jgi:hypothetical protein